MRKSSLLENVEIMGILNVTPDSFYDGGEYNETEKAVARAREMVEEGADIIDIGGESTNPNSEPITVEEEKNRILPVLEKLKVIDAKISVDTRNSETAEAALDRGADMINDVSGLEDPDMRDLIAEKDCRVVVMDSKNIPVERSSEGYGENVVGEVRQRLDRKVEEALDSGIDGDQIIIDPGIGFGRDKPEEDGKLIANTDKFAETGFSVLIGCSRKSFFKGIGDFDVEERLIPSVVANLIAASKGADILRVHDVKQTVKAIETAKSVYRYEE